MRDQDEARCDLGVAGENVREAGKRGSRLSRQMNIAYPTVPQPASPDRALRLDRLSGYLHRAREAHLVEKRGYVTQVIGLVIESAGPMVAVGDICEIEAAGGEKILSEVVGFRGDCVLLMPLREVHGIQPGSPVTA